MSRRNNSIWLWAALILGPAVATAGPVHAPAANGNTYIVVGDSEISRTDFERHLATAARRHFYHGKPAVAELASFREQQTRLLIDQELLAQEAARLDIEPDSPAIDRRLNELTAQYRHTERWQTQGEAMSAALRGKLRRDDVIRQLETRIRDAPEPEEAVLRRWYDEHPEYFTEPARERVAMILLAVAPSAPVSAWQAARVEADTLADQLREGVDFAELARVHSSDSSAAEGGDMGYLHKGMLGETAQQVLGALSVGEVSGPVTLLEGVALFRMLDRQAERLQTFAAVQTRAAALWRRDAGERRWSSELERLRRSTRIEVRDN